jgi:hypothetical protein
VFTPGGFVDDLMARVAAPLKKVQQQIERSPYLTRLYTLISPEEMTIDPVFLYNPDLGDVSNLHRATARYVCDGDEIGAVEIQLEDGRIVTYRPDEWLTLVNRMPAAALVEQMSDTGPGVTVTDNQPLIDGILGEQRRRLRFGGCGCDVGRPEVTSGLLLALALVAAMLWRRRTG